MTTALLRRMLGEFGLDDTGAFARSLESRPAPLPSRLSTGDLAWASVALASIAAGRDPRAIDPDRIAASYRSDRLLTIDNSAPIAWAASSGFWRTADGWIRTHGNYPHHARALHRALRTRADDGPEATRASLAAALLERTTDESVRAITVAGGLAVAVLHEDRQRDAEMRSAPLVRMTRDGAACIASTPAPSPHARPLEGMRVLDLTRVIAGPVCTRTLALLGADVLRIDPPTLAEPEWQHLDTGHGKRSARLDARSSTMHDLLARADAVVLGYRPAALLRLGLDPDTLSERHSHLVIAQLSAWGPAHPERAGFDSLVQAESGIAWVESANGEAPGTLPAQALDHTAGYLLAAAVTTLLRRRRDDGGSGRASTSLRRIAAELLGMPRHDAPSPADTPDLSAHVARFRVAGHDIVTARPALPGLEFDAPRVWGADQPRW